MISATASVITFLDQISLSCYYIITATICFVP